LKSRSQYSPLALLIAAALFVASMPVAVNALPPNGAPAFTLDICHPLQPFDTGSVRCDLPPLLRWPITHELPTSGIVNEQLTTVTTRAAEAPDPPPPKFLA